MCQKRMPSHMAYVPYVGQVTSSALTRWIDRKTTKMFQCNELPFFIFSNVLFHDATTAASTRGYVPTLSPMHPPFYYFFP